MTYYYNSKYALIRSVHKKMVFMLFFLLFTFLNAQAQIGVTVTGATNTTPNLSGSYTSFANFVTALNSVTAVSGPVTATLAAGTSETAPVKGFNISTSTANVFTTTNTLTIVKASGAATVINAGVGTAAGPAASPDGMLYLSGMDGVTIDGLTFTDGNSASSTVAMEFGIAFFKRAAGDGCNGNTIQNCIFNMQRINNASGSTPMLDGSWGIEVLNSTPTAATTSLTPTNGGTLATNGTNSNNKFYSNQINGGNGGIGFGGFAASSGVGPTPTATTFLGDLGNDVGGTGSATATTGNTILNFGGGASSNPSAGIRANNQWSLNVSNNIINNNNGSGVNHATTLRGIFLQAGTSANVTCTYNNVTIKGGGTTSTITAIDNGIGSTASSNTININNNTISGTYTTVTTGAMTCISNTASAATVNVNNNTISSITFTGTSGLFTAILNSGTVGTALNYGSNNINGIALTTTGTDLLVQVGSPNGTVSVTNNTIQNITNAATTGTLRIIHGATPLGLYSVTGNTIDGVSFTAATSTGSIDAIYNLSSATLQNWNNNIIRNLSTPTTGTIRGIINNTTTGTFQMKNNQIYNFSTTAGGAGGASFTGIQSVNGAVDISGNIIYSLKSTGTTGGTAGTINGISITGGTTQTVYNNAIYDLSSTSTGATVNGINIAGGTTNNVYNNLIGDLTATKSTGNAAISGILVSSGTTNNIYHNTVNIASSTSASTFGTSAIYFSSSTPVNNLRNNIFVNTSASGSTGGFAAAIRYTTAPTSTNFPATNNNNFYYAGTPSANSLIYGEGGTATATNGQQTIAAYTTYINTTLPVAGRESASVSEVPNFVSTSGSNPITNFLKYDTSIATQIEAGGVTGTGITTDYAGTTRCPGGGCPGAAASPDRGAWELNGSSPAPAVVINSISPNTQQCTATARLVTVTATTPSPSTITSVVLNYSLNGVAQSPVAMTNTSGNTWTATIPAATPTNAVVAWSVTVTNSVSLTATASGTSYQDDPLFGLSSVATASPTTVCSGSTISLSSYIGGSGTASLGAGSLTSSSTPNTMFSGAWGGQKSQFIIRASELSAAGIVPGNITSIAFEATSAFNGYEGFAVNVGLTTNTVAAFPLITTGLTQVYAGTGTNGAYATTVGVNTLNFSTPIAWDGTSNLVVQFCWAKNPTATSTTGTTIKYDNTSFTSAAIGQKDSTLASSLCPLSLAADFGTTSTGSVRPKFTFGATIGSPLATYSWVDNSTSTVVGSTNPSTVTPVNNGSTYTVTMSNAAGCTRTATTGAVTILSLPNAPTATNGSRCGSGLVTGATVASSNGTTTPTFKWYAAATGGTALQTSTSTSYTTSISATTTLYVTELVGTCESSPRTPITLTINTPPTITVATTTGNQVNCGSGSFNVVLHASSGDAGMTYSWSTSSATAVINSGASTADLNVNVTESADFVVTGTPSDPTCNPIVVTYPVSVYALPNANVTTTATGVCPGTSATINSGLSSEAFSATCITAPSALSTPPVGAVTLINGSGVQVTTGANSTTNQDDNFWSVPIGFSFNYLGTSYTSVFVSTNGILSFTAGTTSFSFPSGFPSTSSPAASIAVCARDMYFTTGAPSALRYWVEGTAPNRRFIVQYDSVRSYDTRAETGTNIGTNSAEAVFYETVGNVDIRVINSNNGTGSTVSPANSTNKLIGLQNAAQTVGAVAPRCSPATPNYWNAVQTEILTPQAWRFAPPANYTVTWSSVGPGNVLTPIQSGTNVFSLTVSPSVTTTYDLRYTNQTTGCTNIVDSDRVTMTIINNVAPTTTAVASVSTICLNGSSVLSLTGNVNSIGNTDGLTYQWQVSTDNGATWSNISGATSATTTVTPAVASTYQCLVAVCNGTAVASSPVTVTFTNNVATTTPGARCGTGTVVLGATTSSPGATLNWYAAASGGTALGTGSSFTTPSISATTTYYVAAETTGPACSSPRVAVTATVNTPPAINLTGGNSAAICVGNSATLTTDADANYDTFAFSPTTGASYSGSGVFTFNPTATTTYTVTASQSTGQLCATTFTYTVNVNSTNVQASSSLPTICLGSSVSLLATSLGGGPSTLPGTYCVPTQAGDSGIATVSFNTLSNTTSQSSPYYNIYPATGSTTTTVTAGQTYPLALTTSGTASIVSVWIDYNRNGTFETSEWNQAWTNASSGTVSITIPANASPGATAMRIRSRNTGNTNGSTEACDTTFGSGTSQDYTINIIADATGSNSYAWTIGSTPIGTGATLNYTPSTLGATTYTVTATHNTNGCTATATTIVTTQNSSAQVTTPPAAQTKCVGGTATFTVVATGVNLTYQWRKGTTNLVNGTNIAGATTATLTLSNLVVGDAGDYNVVISSDCGTPTTSTDATLTIVTPLASINSSASTVCSGTSVNLDENGGSATSWSWAPGGETTRSITVTPTITTTYTVTATTQLTGCTATASYTVTVNQTPTAISVTPSSSTVCSGGIVSLTAAGGTVNTGGTATIGAQTTTEFGGSVYRNGFNTGDFRHQLLYTKAELNAAGIFAGNLTSIAFNVTSVGSGSANNYQIKLASTSATALTSTFNTSTFTTVYNAATYTAVSGTNLHTFTTPFAWDGNSNVIVEICYNISTIGGSSTVAATTPTSISNVNLLGTVGACTVATGSTFANRPLATFGYSIPVSITQNWTTSPSVPLYTDAAATVAYVPGTAAATVYAKPTVNSTYTYTISNGSCPNQGSANVNINALPVITLADNITVCKGTGATITIPEANNNYSWSPATGLNTTTGSSVLANPDSTTTYTVTITNTSNFCQSTDQITVNVNDGGTIVSQPANRIVASGYGTSFTVAGSAGVTYSYQWQIKTGPGTYANLSNDSNYSGVTTNTLDVSNSGSGTALDNASYRCILTPPAPCADLVSNDALLTVSNTGIATSPANVNICLPTPNTAQFTVVTNGDDPYLVEWQVSTDNGTNYNTISLIDVNDTFLYTGPNTTAVPGLTFEHPASPGDPNGTESNFKVLNVSGITSSMNLKFKAIVNEVLPSAVATLNVTTPVSFSTNLSTAEIKVCKNPAPVSANNLSVTTAGDVTSVVWKYDTSPSGSFSNTVTNNTPAGATYTASSTGNNYSLAVTTNGSTPAGSYYYKAFVLGSTTCGTTPLQSDMATITVVNPAVAINASSASYCTPGAAVTLTASGASTYSWTSVPTGFTSTLNGVSVTPTVATAYTVVGTDSLGCTNSASVNVGVGSSFTVTATSAAATVCPSTPVQLTSTVAFQTPNNYLNPATVGGFESGATFPLNGWTVVNGANNNWFVGNAAGVQAGSNAAYVGTGNVATGNASVNHFYRDIAIPAGSSNITLKFYLKMAIIDDTFDYVNVYTTTTSNTPVAGTLPGSGYTTVMSYTSPALSSYTLKTFTLPNSLAGTTVRLVFTYKSDGASPFSAPAIDNIELTANPSVTYAWSTVPSSSFTSAVANPTVTPATTTSYSLTATASTGCAATLASPVTVTVDSTPPTYTTTTPASQSICSGSTVNFAVSATSATALTYQWKKNGVAIPSATSATLTGTTTTATSTASNFTSGTYTVDIIGCSTVTATFNLTVNPLPTATIAGTTTVCQNDSSPVITFTGATGTAPFTFTYTVSGVTGNQTITTTSGNSATLNVPTSASGTTTYTLVSVSDANTCSQTQSGAVSVKVNPLPTAPTLTPVQTVCEGNALVFGASAIPPVTGVSSYSFAASSGTYTPITGGTVLASSSWDDSGAGNAIPLGFSFVFNGATYTTCNINLNGYVSFGTGTTSTTNYTPISTLTTNEVGIVSAFGRDLQGVTTTGEIRYLSTASEFIVQWSNARRYNSTTTNAESFNFQIHLVKNTNQAYIVYGAFSDAISASSSILPQVGLRGSATSDFKNVSVSNTGSWSSPVAGGSNTATAYYNESTVAVKPASGLTYTFTPPGAGTYAWSGPNGFTSSLQNPTIPNATLAATGTYTLQITNGNGCKSSSTVSATVTAQPQWFLDADGDHYYTGAAVVSCTSPGAGYTTAGLLGGGDCNDSNAAINPGAAEICWNNIDDNCNGTMSEACAPVVVNMTPSYNNTTLASLSTAIPAVAYTYPGATNLKYRFRITNITTGAVAPDIIQTSRYVTIPASIHSYNAQYSLTASAVINDEVVPFAGNTIIVNSPVVQLITLSSASCGATLAALTSTLTANAGLNATGYTFRIRVNDTNPSPTYAYSQSSTRFISANSFTGFPLQYGASYKVAVQYTFNDPVTNLPVDSGYGAECTVNTPSIPVTTMASPTCGSQVTAMNANISATAASYATGYQFRIRLFADNGANPTYNTSVANASRFSSLTAFTGQGPLTLAYNTEYAVSVRYSILNGSTTVWSDWGPDCKVKTPFFPVTSLVPSQCGLTTATSLTQQLNITPYPGFPNYKVKLDEVSGEDIVNSQEIVITYPYFRLNQFSIAQLGKNYNVSVAIKLNGEFGPYDTACDLFTPAPAKTNAVVPFKATAYPNPFANNFMLDVKSSSQSNVSVKVYDMIGRMIEQKEVRVSDMETTTIGEQYPSGVYNVVVSQDDSVETVRVVKR